MATKPKSKPVGKKLEKKSKPVVKNKSAARSVKKIAKPAKKTVAPKSLSKPIVTKSKTITPSKSTAKNRVPVKPIIKPSVKNTPIIKPHKQNPIVSPKPILPEVKAEPKPIIENKKLVNKMTSKTTAPATNGKTRYSDTELAEFKKIIDDKLLIARNELNYLQEQIVEMNENNADIQGSDWFDDSSIHAEVELLNNMAIRQRQFIQNLENALVRIENKSYGICMINGTLIDKKRLLLVPHATKSIEAKEVERATMVPEINQVAPDDRVLRRTEGKVAKKGAVKKSKGKSTKEYDDDEGDDMIEAPIEEMDGAFEGGDD